MSISRAILTSAEWQRLKTGDEQLEVRTDRGEHPYLNIWEIGGYRRSDVIAALDAGETDVQARTGGGETILLTVTDEQPIFGLTAWAKPTFNQNKRWKALGDERRARYEARYARF